MSEWRSYLFVPATKLSMIKKAVNSDADSVIIDLEDAVAYSEKDEARGLVKEALSELRDKKPIYVRINDLTTPYWEQDLTASVRCGARGVVVPKSESEDDIRRVCDNVRDMWGMENPGIHFEVIPLLETALGIQFAYDIANADSLVSTLAFGSIDFSLDIGCELTPGGEELLFARSQMVIASKAAGKGQPIDAVFPDLDNFDGLRSETRATKHLGFKGKLLIHPKQIGIVHEVLTPSEHELREAKQIVAEFEKAEQQGLASISVNEKFVDYPVYRRAKELLDTYNN